MRLSPDHPFDPTCQRRAGHPRPIVLLLVGERRVHFEDQRNGALFSQPEARHGPETVALINEIRMQLLRSAPRRFEERQIMKETNPIWVATGSSADHPLGGPQDLG